MKNCFEKIKNNLYPKVILFIGIIIRIIYGIKQTPMHFQHDVVNVDGHLDYAAYIYENFSLPLTNNNQFYQGPLNAIMQTLCMKVSSFFIDPSDFDALYSSCKILSILYSIFTLYIIFKILEILELKKYIKITILAVCAIYPGMVIMAGQYNNDPLAYMFFFLSLYLAIKWSKNIYRNDFSIKEFKKSLINIILLAVSIGLGMLTKISVGLIAFVIGPMFIIIWIKALFRVSKKNVIDVENNKKRFKNITIQFIIFILIVFPLGLSYGTRNLTLFNQPYNYVPKVAESTMLDVASNDVVDRFLSFPLSRIKVKKYDIFHAKNEYNVWVDLLKTSTYEEFNFGSGLHHPFAMIMLICNAIFYLVSIFSIFYFIIILFKKVARKENEIFTLQMNLPIMSFMLIFMGLVSYVAFNVNYPYSCTSNYRYIMYITFANISLVAFMLDSVKNKITKIIFSTICIIFFIAVSCFVILV